MEDLLRRVLNAQENWLKSIWYEVNPAYQDECERVLEQAKADLLAEYEQALDRRM